MLVGIRALIISLDSGDRFLLAGPKENVRTSSGVKPSNGILRAFRDLSELGGRGHLKASFSSVSNLPAVFGTSLCTYVAEDPQVRY